MFEEMTVSRHFVHCCWWLRYGSNFTQVKIHRWCPEITGESLGTLSKPLERAIMSFLYQSHLTTNTLVMGGGG